MRNIRRIRKNRNIYQVRQRDDRIRRGALQSGEGLQQRPITSSYGDDFYTEYGEYVSACKATLDEVSKSPNKDIAQYGKDLSDYVDQLGDIISRMQAIGDIDSIQYGTTQYQQLNDLLDEFFDLETPYDSVSTLTQALQDSAEEADLSDSLSSLYDALADGAENALRLRGLRGELSSHH